MFVKKNFLKNKSLHFLFQCFFLKKIYSIIPMVYFRVSWFLWVPIMYATVAHDSNVFFRKIYSMIPMISWWKYIPWFQWLLQKIYSTILMVPPGKYIPWFQMFLQDTMVPISPSRKYIPWFQWLLQKNIFRRKIIPWL